MIKPASKFITILLIATLLTACQTVVPTPLATVIPTPRVNEPAALAAQTQLSEQLGLSPEKITITKVQPGLWPDSCLGLGGSNESCAQVLTAGFLVTLLADGKPYQFRTDQAGAQIRELAAEAETPPAVLAARQALAGLLKVDPATIAILLVEAVEWQDACLGVATPGTACAQVITPGYRVVLTANGLTFEYHTDQGGNNVVQATISGLVTGDPVIILKTTNAMGACEQTLVTGSGVGLGSCDQTPEIKPFLGMQRQVELNLWVTRYASFEVKGQDGSLTFTGSGTAKAVLEEQQALIAWTRLAAMDVTGEPAVSTDGLLIDWRRTGGLAGVCNRLMIYESGFAYARRCDMTALGQALLPADQIRLLYNWRDNLSSALITASDSVADGFNYELQFNGAGNRAPDDTARQAMLVLAAQLYALLLQ